MGGESAILGVRASLRERGFWLLPMLLCVMLVGMLLLGQHWASRGQPGAARSEGVATSTRGEWVPTPSPVGQTVALTIDFGNGAKREFSALPWRNGLTVADLMEETRHFQPPITFTQQGTGAQAFLTTLEGVAGRADYGKFWFFEINGTRGIRSFGIQSLNPGDRILWTFGSPD